MDCSLE